MSSSFNMSCTLVTGALVAWIGWTLEGEMPRPSSSEASLFCLMGFPWASTLMVVRLVVYSPGVRPEKYKVNTFDEGWKKKTDFIPAAHLSKGPKAPECDHNTDKMEHKKSHHSLAHFMPFLVAWLVLFWLL